MIKVLLLASAWLCILAGADRVSGQLPAIAAPDAVFLNDSVLVGAAVSIVRTSPELAEIWPGFWDARESFIIARTQTTVLLISHQQPGPEFEPVRVEGAPSLDGIAYLRSSFDGLNAASEGTFDLLHRTGAVTATAVSVREDVASTVEFMLHEAFHVHQFTRGIGAPPLASDSAFVTESYNHLAELERRILVVALASDTPNVIPILESYLVVRSRREVLFPRAAAQERETELVEGTAHYIGALAVAAARLVETSVPMRLQAELQKPLDVQHFSRYVGGSGPVLFSDAETRMRWTHRTRLYATGAALALLLDRLSIQWRNQRGTYPGLGQVLSEHLRFNRVGSVEEVQQLLERYGRSEIEARVQDTLRGAGHLPVSPGPGHNDGIRSRDQNGSAAQMHFCEHGGHR